MSNTIKIEVEIILDGYILTLKSGNKCFIKSEHDLFFRIREEFLKV